MDSISRRVARIQGRLAGKSDWKEDNNGCLMWADPCQVYRLYDEHGRLLWVGSSIDATVRLSEHRRKAWGKDIVRMTVKDYPNQQAAHIAEDYAMVHEMPLHNKHRRWCLKDQNGYITDTPLPEMRRRQRQKPDMPGGTWLQ